MEPSQDTKSENLSEGGGRDNRCAELFKYRLHNILALMMHWPLVSGLLYSYIVVWLRIKRRILETLVRDSYTKKVRNKCKLTSWDTVLSIHLFHRVLNPRFKIEGLHHHAHRTRGQQTYPALVPRKSRLYKVAVLFCSCKLSSHKSLSISRRKGKRTRAWLKIVKYLVGNP